MLYKYNTSMSIVSWQQACLMIFALKRIALTELASRSEWAIVAPPVSQAAALAYLYIMFSIGSR